VDDHARVVRGILVQGLHAPVAAPDRYAVRDPFAKPYMPFSGGAPEGYDIVWRDIIITE
jgi:hypothetical protein